MMQDSDAAGIGSMENDERGSTSSSSSSLLHKPTSSSSSLSGHGNGFSDGLAELNEKIDEEMNTTNGAAKKKRTERHQTLRICKGFKFRLEEVGKGDVKYTMPVMVVSMRCCGTFCVSFVCSWMIYAYFSIWGLIFWHYEIYNSFWLSMAVLLYHTIIVMSWVCYYKAINTSPGFVPPGWTPEDYDLEAGTQLPMSPTTKRSLDKGKEKEDPGAIAGDGPAAASVTPAAPIPAPTASGATWCLKCSSYRPARAHHCRHCKACVLAMDHHCPWVNNCVGHRNSKAFFLFLCYAAATLLIGEMLYGFRAFDIYIQWEQEKQNPTRLGILVVLGLLNMGIGGFFAVFLLGMAVSFGVTMALDLGTIDRKRKHSAQIRQHRLRNLARRKRGLQPRMRRVCQPRPVVWYFNNVKSIMGENIVAWLWPTLPPTDGYHYPPDVAATGDGNSSSDNDDDDDVRELDSERSSFLGEMESGEQDSSNSSNSSNSTSILTTVSSSEQLSGDSTLDRKSAQQRRRTPERQRRAGDEDD